MKRIIKRTLGIIAAALGLTAFAAFGNAFEATPEQLQEASHIRAVGLDMGLDKLSGEDIASIGMEMNQSEGGGEAQALTEEQKEAINCFSAEMIKIQFYGELEVFARLLNDEVFEEQVQQQLYEKCGLDQLIEAGDQTKKE